MFGYIIPYRSELKVRELEEYKSCYCALCRELRREYGFLSSMWLNYDFVFLAMLLSNGEVLKPCTCKCPVSLKRKPCFTCCSDSYKRSASYSIILTWWKLCDAVTDEGAVKKLKALLLKMLLRPSYKKASGDYPDFALTVCEKIKRLSELERENNASIDCTADVFGSLLAAASDGCSGEKKRIVHQILYHIGRIIYIADAYDDIGEDLKNGNYNPFIAGYGVHEQDFYNSEKLRSETKASLLRSSETCCASFELLSEDKLTGLLRNILYIGIPAMIDAVIKGKFRRKEKGLPE